MIYFTKICEVFTAATSHKPLQLWYNPSDEAISTKQDINQAHDVEDINQTRTLDQLHVAELINYNKRRTCYFVKFILILMRIIYCLSRARCNCSGSPRRMTRTQKEKITEKDHTRTRPVLQNSPKESVITFDSQKLWWSMCTFFEILSSLLSNGILAEYF